MDAHDFFQPLREAAAGRSASAVGIDLGTTNSTLALAAIDAEGRITVEALRDGPADDPAAPITVPSVVACDPLGWHVVGRDARLLLARSREHEWQKHVFAETKNEIGLKYTYWKARQGFETPVAIAGHVLDHLHKTFAHAITGAGEPVVIGVPAAFQGTQRSATLEAARRAPWGAEARQVRLVDEPVAAFLDLLADPTADRVALDALRRLVVFDFGGGTCDVALFDLDFSSRPAQVRLRGTSRYHRLGGGDIDRAIVHRVLLPRLLADNGIDPLDLSWRTKKREIEPRLLLAAEQLKHEMARQLAAARTGGGVLADGHEVRLGEPVRVEVDGRTLVLRHPRLSHGHFRILLAPFLDRAARLSREGEYYSATSIFEPVEGLMDRLGIDPASVDGVLFAGGSSLLPQVREAVLDYFPQAIPLGGQRAERLQGAVARGAALQALSIVLTGEPLVRPVAGMSLAVRLEGGRLPLVEEGEAVPIHERCVTLAAPRDADDGLDLSVELCADGERNLFRQSWRLPGTVRRGEPLDLRLEVDESQCLRLTLKRRFGGAKVFHHVIDSPFAHTDAAHPVRMRVLEREEQFRNGEIDDAARGEVLRKLAWDYAQLGQHEKAIDAMRQAIRWGADRALGLNAIGLWYGNLGDAARKERCLQDAMAEASFATPHFNLALLRRDAGDLEAAMALADKAVRFDPDEPAYRLLRVDLLQRLGRHEAARAELAAALAARPAARALSDWQIGWLEWAANQAADAALKLELRLERERRRADPLAARIGSLPLAAAASD